MRRPRLMPLTASSVLFSLLACAPAPAPLPTAEEASVATAQAPVLPPEPVVTYRGGEAEGERIEHGELIVDVDEARQALHAQHHPHGVIETRRVPGTFEPPAMTEISDFALSKDDLVVINPGHGYQNLTIGITYTAPGGAPPMHTHLG